MALTAARVRAGDGTGSAVKYLTRPGMGRPSRTGDDRVADGRRSGIVARQMR